MTGYETLWFFGRIRGMNPEALHLRCLELIGQVGLTNHAFKPCGTYSGGNKRFSFLSVPSSHPSLASSPLPLLSSETLRFCSWMR